MQMLQGQRPDLTPAQLTGLLAAGVPVIANLLHVFGVYDVSPEQQDALNKLIQYGALVAIGLFGSDLGLRAARNHADAKVKAAVLNVPDGPPLGPTGPVVNGATLGLVTATNGGTAPAMGSNVGLPSNGSADTDLPTDEEEFGPGGPDDDQGPESRLQPVVPEDDQP